MSDSTKQPSSQQSSNNQSSNQHSSRKIDCLSSITLHQLHLFETTARHRNITRAGEELSITQPTVSVQLKQLSKSIGLPLFEQVGKQLYLTEAGEAVYQVCQDIFKQLTRLDEALANLRGVKQGKLKISAVKTSKYFLPRLLTPFCQAYPDISLSLELAQHHELLERVEQNSDDFYIMSHLPDRNDIEAIPFLLNPLVVVAAVDHPLTQRESIDLTTLTQEPLILQEPGAATRLAIEQLFQKEGIDLRIKMELDSNETIRQFVMQGFGISVLSLHSLILDSLILESHHPQIAILNVEGFPIYQDWYVVSHQGRATSVVAQAFLDYLLAESKNHYPSYATLDDVEHAIETFVRKQKRTAE